MIEILILEDEIPARKKLRRLLEDLGAPIEIKAEVDTVEAGISFLKENTVDLIFSDIELLDGNSFEIYNQVAISCPIIFTTAYNQFWMNAFETNGIDYLLKPFSRQRFQKAWDKYMLLKNTPGDDKLVTNLTQLLAQNFMPKTYKKRFTVYKHDSVYFLEVTHVTFFEANESVVFAFDISGKKHLLRESTLKEIEEQLDPLDYFRINRGELISKQHIEKIERYDKNTLAIKMKATEKYLKTSQGNTSAFRKWMDQ